MEILQASKKRIRVLMSYIIGKACDGVCDTICVKVYPVDCIHKTY